MSSKRRRHVEIGYSDKKGRELPKAILFEEVAVLPEPGDNCAIARVAILKGALIKYKEATFEIDHNILEGHRFCVKPTQPGDALLSWRLRFGVCVRPLVPGQYVCNERMLISLRGRGITDLPAEPNFEDKIEPFLVDEKTFTPAEQVPLLPEEKRLTFTGYKREGARGVGTRNFVVLIASSSLTSSYVKSLETHLKAADVLIAYPNVDGIASINHTECGGLTRPNNYEMVLRTLSGFVVHPNCGAALVVDYGSEVLTCRDLQDYMETQKVPLRDVPHTFLTLTGDTKQDLKLGEEAVKALLPRANRYERSDQPLSNLKIALQCGGSDAFSGVSGNPTAGYAAKLLIQHGGAAVLAETPELIGAEPYILQKVKDLKTAQKFLSVVERFKRLSEFHGFTAEQNPSGGNNFRGLYNIALKSIGAGKKKNADVRLDYVLDYAESIRGEERGYYFMDSPGNDLESIAGQVAVGCNLIFFITGNGSITNFPFVPTIKILTTTRRYELLKKDMDFNAGRFQDSGVPISTLGEELFSLTLKHACGIHTIGERAGHSQVCIWRNWAQTESIDLKQFSQIERSGIPLHLKESGFIRADDADLWRAALSSVDEKESKEPWTLWENPSHSKSWSRLGLILPTSLCSGQVALMIAQALNQRLSDEDDLKAKKKEGKIEEVEEEKEGKGGEKDVRLKDYVSRFVALPHTEGCGTGYSQGGEQLYTRTMVGHLLHPSVHFGLLLEHGCEKHHNDFMQSQLKIHHADPTRFGWASVQLDGGLDSVKAKCLEWFDGKFKTIKPLPLAKIDSPIIKLGLFVLEEVSNEIASVFVAIVRWIVTKGGSVVVPKISSLLHHSTFVDELMEGSGVEPSLAFGQRIPEKSVGVQVMDSPTDHWVENVTALCATGCDCVLTFTTRPIQGHPLIPVISITTPKGERLPFLGADLILSPPSEGREWRNEWLSSVLGLMRRVACGTYHPKAEALTDFQISRGKTAFST